MSDQMKTDTGPWCGVPLWLFECDEVTHTDIAIYTALGKWANSDRECFPSHAAIAKFAKTSTSTVKRSLKRLQKAGALSVQSRKKDSGKPDSNLYTLHMIRQSVGSPVDLLVTDDPEVGVTSEPVEGSPVTYELDPINQNHLNHTSGLSEPDLSAAERLAEQFAEAVTEHHPTRKRHTASKAWIADIDRAMRIDGFTAVQVSTAIVWLFAQPPQRSGFSWGSVVRSGKKLRQHLPTIVSQMQTAGVVPGGRDLIDEAFAAVEARGEVGR